MTPPNNNNNNGNGNGGNGSGGENNGGSSNQMVWPSNPRGALTSGFGMRWGRMHEGVDIAVPEGSNAISVLDGTLQSKNTDSGGYGYYIDIDHGDGVVTRYAHLQSLPNKETGTQYNQGDVAAKTGNTGSSTGPHLHFEVLKNGTPVDPMPYIQDGQVVSGGGDLSGGGSSGGMLDEATAKSAAFATYFNIDGLWDTATSQELKGEKSLMNDKPLFPFIEQICSASLRRFQSMPNGNFFAFYPDYFGGSGHRSPYWDITEVEIIDGQIELNDDALATHVFVVGDTSPFSFFDGVDVRDKVDSAGVINIFNAFQANFITGHNQQSRAEQESANDLVDEVVDGDAFLKKYGARPYYEEAPMVRSAFYEAFLAYQKFCLLWSQQFATSFSLTFMPEIFPGGIVRFPDHNLQMFVEEVTHSFDYESGFNTDVVFSSPASTDKTGKAHEGMIRAGVLKGI